MADTIAGIIDKLITCGNKMFITQDDFYKLRKLSEEEFLKVYSDPEKLKELYKLFWKGIDLNLQRNQLMDELDIRLVELTGAKDDGKNIQRKHKTYDFPVSGTGFNIINE